jgi:hypothetical protein
LELELEKKKEKEVVVREHAAFVRRCPVVFARLRPSRRVPVRCPKPLPNFTHNLGVQSTISGRAFIPLCTLLPSTSGEYQGADGD